MRNFRHIIFCSALMFCSLGSLAQNTTPEFVKPKFEVTVADSVTSFELSDDYSVRKGTYKSLYEFSKYDALKPKKLEIDKIPSLYARFGVQFPLMPQADLDYRKMLNENIVFGLKGHHDSWWKATQNRMHNGVGGDMKVVWKEGEFTFGTDYANHYLKFKDASAAEALHKVGDLGVYARVCSANEQMNDIFYDFKCTFDYLENNMSAFYLPEQMQLRENKFGFKGYVGTTFDIHRIYVDIDIKTAGYGGVKEYTTSMVEFSPMYEFKVKRFYGKFGVVFGNRFGVCPEKTFRSDDGNLMEAVSSIFPNVDARVEIARRLLWAHLEVDGGYDLNTYSDLFSSCQVINPTSPLMVGKHPVDANLALESVWHGRFSLNLSAGFRMDQNRPYVAPVMGGSDVHSLLACHMDVNTLSAGAEALWKSSSITAGGEFHYNKYFSTEYEKVTQFPAITSRLFFRYNWRQRLVVSLECDYASPVSGEEFGAYSVPDKIDLSAEVNFALTRHFRVFVKGGNLLNRKNQLMPTYDEPGLNLGGGVAVTF